MQQHLVQLCPLSRHTHVPCLWPPVPTGCDNCTAVPLQGFKSVVHFPRTRTGNGTQVIVTWKNLLHFFFHLPQLLSDIGRSVGYCWLHNDLCSCRESWAGAHSPTCHRGHYSHVLHADTTHQWNIVSSATMHSTLAMFCMCMKLMCTKDWTCNPGWLHLSLTYSVFLANRARACEDVLL